MFTEISPGSRMAADPQTGPEVPGLELVWSGHVPSHAAEARRYEHWLDAAERERLASLRRTEDRDRCRTAHVALRRLLADHLGGDPAEVVIRRAPCFVCGGPHGRPVIPRDPVHFSLSHAGDQLLIALATEPVGVDVEKVPDATAVTELAGTLHPAERSALDGMSGMRRRIAFTRCWSRKEALLKGTGAGLNAGLATVCSGVEAVPAQPEGWRVADLPAAAGYAAACAVKRR
ncbi:4'-phosphopantetheinyl transferase family protein [Streptomyces tauricus]|uniref:4'-phosphopantetheinyl transferase family protein n=1 Tax=Streptomyces tauricus TaxID=68274 RepID=UPI00342BA38A